MKKSSALMLGLLLTVSAAGVAAQQSPLPCAADSRTLKADAAIWEQVKALDNAAVYARYVRMRTACHYESALRRIEEIQNALLNGFAFTVRDSVRSDLDLTGKSGAELGDTSRSGTLLIVKGKFDLPPSSQTNAGSGGKSAAAGNAASLSYNCAYWFIRPGTANRVEENPSRKDGQDCGWIPDAPDKAAINMLQVGFEAAGRYGAAVDIRSECMREPPRTDWADCHAEPNTPANRITRVRVTVLQRDLAKIAESASSDTPLVCDGTLLPNPAGVIAGDVAVPPGKSCTIARATVIGNVTVGAGASLYALGTSIFGNVVARGARQVRFNYAEARKAPPRGRAARASNTEPASARSFVSGNVILANGKLEGASVLAEGLLIGRNLDVNFNTAASPDAAVVLCTTDWCHDAITVGGSLSIRDNKDKVRVAINNTDVGGHLRCSSNAVPVQLSANKPGDLVNPPYWPARNVHARQAFDECAGFLSVAHSRGADGRRPARKK